MKHFGTTLNETFDALGAHLGRSRIGSMPKSDRIEAIGRIVISFLLFAAGLFLVVYDRGQSQTIGATLFGGIIGYWLK